MRVSCKHQGQNHNSQAICLHRKRKPVVVKREGQAWQAATTPGHVAAVPPTTTHPHLPSSHQSAMKIGEFRRKFRQSFELQQLGGIAFPIYLQTNKEKALLSFFIKAQSTDSRFSYSAGVPHRKSFDDPLPGTGHEVQQTFTRTRKTKSQRDTLLARNTGIGTKTNGLHSDLCCTQTQAVPD